MKQTITIEVPEGKTYKQTTDKDGNIIIQYVDKEPIRSKSWDEFCKNHPIVSNTEWCIAGSILTSACKEIKSREAAFNQAKGYLSNKEDAEGILSLIQLIRLHDEWVGDWSICETVKANSNWYAVRTYIDDNKLNVEVMQHYKNYYLLSFPTYDMAREFLECFKDLIEKSKRFI